MADPIAVMLDRGSDFEVRRVAVEQARRDHWGQPRWERALWRVVLGRGYPDWQRRGAVDDLVTFDEAKFRGRAVGRLKDVPDLETLAYLFDLVVERGWRDLTPGVVGSYAQQWPRVADQDRPERVVLEQLNPGKSAEEVSFEVFAGTDERASVELRVLAWELLSRLMTRPDLEGWLAAARGNTALVADLQAGLAELGVLPVTREEVLWLMYLRGAGREVYWERAGEVVAKLTPDQRQGLALRHLGVLVAVDEGLLRHETSADPSWAWADGVVLEMLRAAIRDDAAVRELFRQADADHGDTTTEFGGVLDFAGGRFNFRLYEPVLRSHDRKFHPPQAMIEQLYTSIAHYHFHAQDYKNGRYAMPGSGDLKLADRLRFNFLVFTFVSRDELNADLYLSGGVVIDLGAIQRPTGVSGPVVEEGED